MDYLLNSRLDRSQSPLHLDSLSPQKFGRSAYANLSYTPSKLSANILYKQASSMRKIEESSSKAREWQTLNSVLNDKLRHLSEEKAGIEQTLNQQLVMYKRMIGEMEGTHQKRIRSLQGMFNDQINKIIQAKEEEAKYVQSEKELMENRIYQLEEVIAGLKAEVTDLIQANESSEKEIEELKNQIGSINKEKMNLLGKLNDQIADNKRLQDEFQLKKSEMLTNFDKKAMQQSNQLKKQLLKCEQQSKQKLQSQNAQNQRVIDSMKFIHQSQSQKLQNQRNTDRLSFQSQKKALNQALSASNEKVRYLSESLKQQKQKMMDLVRKHTSQMATMANQRQKIMLDAETSAREANSAKEQAKRFSSNTTQTIQNYQASIDRLKKEVEGLERQLMNRGSQITEMRTEIIILRKSVQKSRMLQDENGRLIRQLKGIKQLLMQSSLQMQRCKGEFVRLDRQKDLLVCKLQELDIENQTLYRLKLQMEEQVRIWRQKCYKNR